MFNINQYLDKFKNLGQKEKDIKLAFISVVKKMIGVDIDIKEVDLSGGELIIKTSSNIKNTIYIKKEKILKDMDLILEKKVHNIR